MNRSLVRRPGMVLSYVTYLKGPINVIKGRSMMLVSLHYNRKRLKPTNYVNTVHWRSKYHFARKDQFELYCSFPWIQDTAHNLMYRAVMTTRSQSRCDQGTGGAEGIAVRQTWLLFLSSLYFGVTFRKKYK